MVKSFKIGGKIFSISEVDHDSGDLGRADCPLNKIQIQRRWEGKEVPASTLEQTVYHEVVHCILNEMGRNDLSSDETFVQTFSLLLHQFETTKE